MIEIINKICAQLPPGWTIELCMTHDEPPWVNLVDSYGRYPRSNPNKTIIEQLNDALLVAKGWMDTP